MRRYWWQWWRHANNDKDGYKELPQWINTHLPSPIATILLMLLAYISVAFIQASLSCFYHMWYSLDDPEIKLYTFFNNKWHDDI